LRKSSCSQTQALRRSPGTAYWSLGIADVLHKPFDADRLLRIVGSHCHRDP
jgi:DNA-binding response OmpR family regulator